MILFVGLVRNIFEVFLIFMTVPLIGKFIPAMELARTVRKRASWYCKNGCMRVVSWRTSYSFFVFCRCCFVCCYCCYCSSVCYSCCFFTIAFNLFGTDVASLLLFFLLLFVVTIVFCCCCSLVAVIL